MANVAIRCPACGMGVTGPFVVGEPWPLHTLSNLERFNENCDHSADNVIEQKDIDTNWQGE